MVILTYLPSGQLNLKEVKKIANDTRFKWFDIGIELDIDLDILAVSVTTYSFNFEVPTSVHSLIINIPDYKFKLGLKTTLLYLLILGNQDQKSFCCG